MCAKVHLFLANIFQYFHLNPPCLFCIFHRYVDLFIYLLFKFSKSIKLDQGFVNLGMIYSVKIKLMHKLKLYLTFFSLILTFSSVFNKMGTINVRYNIFST